jgi:hypothetical protein
MIGLVFASFPRKEVWMVLTVLIVLLVVALLSGGFLRAHWGGWGWSPIGLILIVALILWLTGVLHF